MRYPATGKIEYTWQAYDVMGNRTESRDYSWNNGQITLWATNGWTYDALSRPVTQTVRDGARTTFGYDAAGNLTNRAVPGNFTWCARYNSAGQLETEYNLSPNGLGSRTNIYTYYGANDAWAGQIQTRTDGRGVASTYSYDDWLRPVTNIYTGPLSQHNLTNTWRYDARGLLTDVTQNYTNSAAWPGTAVHRSYDAYGLLGAETSTLGGAPHSNPVLSQDAAGRRRSLAFGPSFYQTYGWRADGVLASSGAATYGFDDAGQLVSRAVDGRTTSIGRDGAGRALAITNAINGTVKLSEALTWTGDGRLATHTLAREDFTDSRAFFYANWSRRLIEERLNLDGSHRWTNIYTYDNGQPGGPGALTQTGPSSGSTTWSGGTDSLSRVRGETNTVVRRTAYGQVNGPATVMALLDGQPMPITLVGTQAMQWRAALELTPGAHQLQASALHPSTLYTAGATNWFTNNAASERLERTYDAIGQVTQLVWKDPSNQVVRTQTLTWDGPGRLVNVTERDSQNNGYDWSAVYDGLDRRLRTTTIPVTNGVGYGASRKLIDQYFDPEVEFLELGISENGSMTWKLYGPDLDGTYGGLNGMGGLDAVMPGSGLTWPVLSDARGNLHATYEQGRANLTWHSSRVTGYGAVPGYRPVPLGGGAKVQEASAWRGKWADIHGRLWLGKRYLRWDVGQFESADPNGHEGSDNLFTYTDGDPINRVDHDGRDWLDSGSWSYGYGGDYNRAFDDSFWQELSGPNWAFAGIDSMGFGRPTGATCGSSVGPYFEDNLRGGDPLADWDTGLTYGANPVDSSWLEYEERFADTRDTRQRLQLGALNALTLGLANTASSAIEGQDLYGAPVYGRERTLAGVDLALSLAPLVPWGRIASGASRLAGEISFAAKTGEVLRAPESWTMSYLRNGVDVPVPQGTSGIRNMMANMTADSGNEVALLRLTDGTRVLRMGGPKSVTLGSDVETVIAHTHPSGSFNFSTADIVALWKRDQLSSVLINPKTGLGKRVGVNGNW